MPINFVVTNISRSIVYTPFEINNKARKNY